MPIQKSKAKAKKFNGTTTKKNEQPKMNEKEMIAKTINSIKECGFANPMRMTFRAHSVQVIHCAYYSVHGQESNLYIHAQHDLQ